MKIISYGIMSIIANIIAIDAFVTQTKPDTGIGYYILIKLEK